MEVAPGSIVRLPSLKRLALAIDPVTPTTLYAGVTGGVLKSTGRRRHLEQHRLGFQRSRLAIDPAPPSTLYAGTAGDGTSRYQPGRHLEPPEYRPHPLFIQCPGIDPQTPTTVYARPAMRLRPSQTSSEITTVSFDKPAPDAGTASFRASTSARDSGRFGPYNVNPTTSTSPTRTGTSRSFQFTLGSAGVGHARVQHHAGDTDASDDRARRSLGGVTGSLQLVTRMDPTPTTVTVSFTNGWDLGSTISPTARRVRPAMLFRGPPAVRALSSCIGSLSHRSNSPRQ